MDGSGMVSAVAPGTCTISVWEYESDTTVTYTVTVTDEIPETSAQETEQAAPAQAGESEEKASDGSPLVIWISVILGVGAAALLVYFRKKR